MIQLPDYPIISCMERTGYAPWMDEEVSEEHDDYWASEPFAVYDPAW